VGTNPCRFLAALGMAFAIQGACARSPQKPEPPAARGAPGGLAPALERGPGEQGSEPEREPRSKDPTVYVDGVPTAVLAYLELPSSLPTRWKTLKSGRVVRRFRVAELLEALGLDLASVKQVHLYGGRDRISILQGAELRRRRAELLFSFTQSDRGKPRIHYPDEAMNVSGRIDLIDNVAVYVRREPPRSEGKHQTLTFGDGGPAIEGIPYAAGERPGGTRVYVDGALRTFVKRKSLPGSIAEPAGSGNAPPRFLLRGYLDTLGIAWSSLKALELIGSTDVLTCLNASALALLPSLAFTLPRRSRGLLAVDLPDATEPVQAIALYTKTLPPGRVDLTAPQGPHRQPVPEGVGGRRGIRCARVVPSQ
jgi:hypothetical protein